MFKYMLHYVINLVTKLVTLTKAKVEPDKAQLVTLTKSKVELTKSKVELTKSKVELTKAKVEPDKAQLDKPTPNRRGEFNGRAVLVEWQVLAIRRMYKAGKITQALLGAKFGVARSTISAVTTVRTWKYLDPEGVVLLKTKTYGKLKVIQY